MLSFNRLTDFLLVVGVKQGSFSFDRYSVHYTSYELFYVSSYQ